MKRLTTDNPQGNTANILNVFYIKDGETWVRGGGDEPDYEDVPLRDIMRRIIRDHKLDITTKPIEMDENLYELLFDGVDTIEGVVALLYSAAWAFSELREELKAYEDTGLTPEEVAELAQAKRDGQLVILDKPMQPVISIDEGARLLCPSCRNDLMGGDDIDKIMYQCPYCGQSIDTTKAITED